MSRSALQFIVRHQGSEEGQPQRFGLANANRPGGVHCKPLSLADTLNEVANFQPLLR
jgi:hypothetical protein